MSKYTKEFKLLIAKRYEHESISYRDLAGQVGVDDSVIRYWVLLFRHHGDNAFDFPYTNYPGAFKLRVIQFINDTDYSIREASAIFHIPDPSMVRRWKKKWETAGEGALDTKEKGPSTMKSHNQKKNTSKDLVDQSREAMEKELEYLRMENAYLKKLEALVQEERSPKRLKRK
jgi:transposase